MRDGDWQVVHKAIGLTLGWKGDQGEAMVEARLPSCLARFRHGDGLQLWDRCGNLLLKLTRCAVDDKWTNSLIAGKPGDVDGMIMYLQVSGTLEMEQA